MKERLRERVRQVVDVLDSGDEARAAGDLDGVRELWAAAMNASGRDNISIALVRRIPPTPTLDR